MKKQESYQVTLDNFEGPLEFLLYLVQKNEIDIYDVRLQTIADQFIKEIHALDLDQGAEFVGTLASLLWLKSKLLLPKHEQEAQDENHEGPDPQFEVIHQLIDYCKFKEAGRRLVIKEHEQNAYFRRGVQGDIEVKQPLGVNHLSIEDLAGLFQDVVAKAKENSGKVFEENFRVSDKIREIRRLLKTNGSLAFESLFSSRMVRAELIVTFLAVLELMKLSEIAVVKDLQKEGIIIVIKKEEAVHEPGN